ncbi:MAG: hypothetical protein R3C03_23945 [Pirellulaceae bacterium]
MINELFRAYGIRIHTDDIDPAQVIGALQNFSVGDDVSVERETVDGNIFPSLTSILAHAEKMEFSSLNVDKIIDIVGSVGLCARGVSTQSGFEFFMSKIDGCTPGVDTSAVNMKYSCASNDPTNTQKFGLLTPATLTANQGQNAQMGFMFTPESKTGNAAIVVSEDVSLPSIADTKTRFTLDKRFIINGVSITSKKSLQINFGASMLLEKADDALAPEWVSLENLSSIITVTGIDPKWALNANIPRGGKAFTHANCEFYLKKRNPDSATGYYAENTNNHIKGTAAGKAFITNLASGQGNRVAETALVMYVEFDGTNAPIALSTNQQIPTS